MLTAAFSGNTPHSAVFLLTQNGAAGVDLIMTPAVLQAAAPAGTPIGDLLRRSVFSQAEAQRIMQGMQLDIPPETDKRVGRCTTQGLINGLAPGIVNVSANVNGAAIELNVTSTPGAGTWLLYIDMLHTLTR